jgi:myo-inositol-1(or 4)-monophosphatase
MRAQEPASPHVARTALIQDMLDAVARAEANARRFWRSPDLKALSKENKALRGKRDYLTHEVDERNQRIVFDYLDPKYAHVSKLGEELGLDKPTEAPSIGDTRWVLDPIDSTRNFVAGNSDYSISLAHQEFGAGAWHTIAAVVAAPGHNKVFWAEADKGAYLTKGDGRSPDASRLIDEPVRVKVHPPTENATCTLEAALLERTVEILLVKEAEPLELSVIHQLHVADRRAIRMIDSGALALALIGTERDGMITGGLTEYDKAAGLLIAREAGAAMAELQLEGLNRSSGSTLHIVAADQPMLRALVDVVHFAIQQDAAQNLSAGPSA